ncbi:hypothetical protein AVEN_197789-1 [Araneus ventricosus]|uniref:Uncharacterized protein n=1 Tax=Araneus ventricosus TaxID=182803 RepID=A0A4Y2HNA6_ARAVE|nr:hypothetical protein AVEN_197789-1 [Araneus ventricosus]
MCFVEHTNSSCLNFSARCGKRHILRNTNVLVFNLKKCSLETRQDGWNLSETGRRTFLFVPEVSINRATFNSKMNHYITEYGTLCPVPLRLGLCPQDRSVCGEGVPNRVVAI